MNTREKLKVIRNSFCLKPEQIEAPNGHDTSCPFCVSWDLKTNILQNVRIWYLNMKTKKLEVPVGTKRARADDSHLAIAVDIARQFLRLNGKTQCNHKDELLPYTMIHVKHIEECSEEMFFKYGKTNHDPAEVIPLLSDFSKVRETFDLIKSELCKSLSTTNKEKLSPDDERHILEIKLNDQALSVFEEVGPDFISSLNPEGYRFNSDLMKVK